LGFGIVLSLIEKDVKTRKKMKIKPSLAFSNNNKKKLIDGIFDVLCVCVCACAIQTKKINNKKSPN